MKSWWIRKSPPITQRPYIIYATFIHDKYPLHHLQNFSIIIFLVIRKPSSEITHKKIHYTSNIHKKFSIIIHPANYPQSRNDISLV